MRSYCTADLRSELQAVGAVIGTHIYRLGTVAEVGRR